MSSTEPLPTPIEVWLSQTNMQITCMEVHEDESVDYLDVDSLSMRGAQREITGLLLRKGYEPVGRWEYEVEETDNGGESHRRFRLKEGAAKPA